ncbi:DUF333 domain-containing protein [Ilumatobacter sp.]|uniref:putative hemolysin n=1 Tax=Ilumatobacter sp. TaxID=1967498 RepID=UPI003C4EEBD4
MRSRLQAPIGLVAVLTFVGSIAACGSDDAPTEDPVTEANPASVFCVDQGGAVDIVDEADGQVGYCVLPDGTRVDEWEYFRANSPDATSES